MEHNDILQQQKQTNAGMTVPEGYFDDFNKRMAAALPVQDWEQPDHEANILPRTRWQKIRPYVYLAAMFMGIWCMMNMFDLIRNTTATPGDINSNPALLSAVNNDAFYFDYCVDDMTDNETYDDLYDQGFDPSELNAD